MIKPHLALAGALVIGASFGPSAWAQTTQDKELLNKAQQIETEAKQRDDISTTSKVFDVMDAKYRQQRAMLANKPLPERLRDLWTGKDALPEATEQLQKAIATGSKLKKPASNVARQADAFVRYLKWKGVKLEPPNTGALERLSAQEKAREAISTAQRIDPLMRFAFETEFADSVPVDFRDKLVPFAEEVVRLKWLTSHLK